jgi:hypothetical protein
MKTKILSIFLTFVAISAISKSTYAAAVNHADYVILNDIKAINKIEIHGNVELFISNGSTEQVKVYNKYYSERALVQSSNGILRISSYNSEKLVVWVASENLISVSAFDMAEVISFGKVSKIEFSVDLHDYATAKLNFDAYITNVTLTGHSKIELSGTVNELCLNRNEDSTVLKSDLVADHYYESKMIVQTVTGKDDLLGLE